MRKVTRKCVQCEVINTCSIENYDIEDFSVDVSKPRRIVEKIYTASTKKPKTNTLLDFFDHMPKNPGECVNILTGNPTKQNDMKTRGLTKSVTKKQIDCRNVWCPIPGCGNWGGKGFRRTGISKHLMDQHSSDLLRTSLNFALVKNLVELLNRIV